MPNFAMRLYFLLTENGFDTRKEAAELAINPGMLVLGVELTDSHFVSSAIHIKIGSLPKMRCASLARSSAWVKISCLNMAMLTMARKAIHNQIGAVSKNYLY